MTNFTIDSIMALAAKATRTDPVNYPLPPKGKVPSPAYRRRNDDYLLPSIAGSGQKAYPSDRTLADAFVSQNDDVWAARGIVEALAAQPELLDDVRNAPDSEKSAQAARVASSVQSARASEAGRWGMAVTSWIHAWDYGTITPDEVPELMQPVLGFYINLRMAYGLDPVPGLYRHLAYNESTGSISKMGGVYSRPDGRLLVASVRTGHAALSQAAGEAVRGGNILGATHVFDPTSRRWATAPEELANADIGVITVPKDSETMMLNIIPREGAERLLDVAKDIRSTVGTLSTTMVAQVAEDTDVVSLEHLAQTSMSRDRFADMFEIYRDDWTAEHTNIANIMMTRSTKE